MSNLKKIAFFGATGDCAGYCLAKALEAGYDCVALARTPSKMIKAMKEKGVSPEALDRHLSIVEGNVKDIAAVKRALQWNDQIVDVIVSGIGGTPVLQWSVTQPVSLTDRTICQDTGRTIMTASQQVNPSRKPLFINISTIGSQLPGMPRDIPLLLLPLYKWLLSVPESDKRVLRDMLNAHAELPESERGFGNFINVKPSLLLDGPAKGLTSIRQGIDENPAVGYTIRRADVGLWIFKQLLESEPDAAWYNNGITLTY